MAGSHRPLLAVFETAITALALVGLFVVQVQFIGAATGFPALRSVPEASALALPAAQDGPIEAEYCSEAVAAHDPDNPAGRTSTRLELEDAWFDGSSQRYRHGIATGCAVLSAVCNSESHFYGGGNDGVPYAERALGSLGFTHVRTDSYALRSAVLDQMAALVNGSHDVAAYTFASKRIAAGGTTRSEAGAEADTLVFVGIRGSYGAEWLSNFNLPDAESSGADHRGFKTAEQEVEASLERYLAEIGADPARTRIVVTGHSRGGAIANLLAADLIDRASGPDALAPVDRIFAYTFAAPCSTQANDRNGEAYAGIFNVVNPSDLVPQLPLSAWGYGRYGTTVELPGLDDARFASSLALMQQAYQANTGTLSAYDAESLARLDSFDAQAAQSLPTLESLLNPAGLASAVQALLGVDLGLAMTSHYPDTYIAWMQTLDGSALTFVRSG